MTEEEDFEFENEEQQIISRKDKRINSLSEKLGLSEKEKAEAAAKAEAEAQAKAAAEKERDFYKGFNQVSAKYPGASEYQDKILEKVNAGYDVEDATISILAKEGKFTAPTPPKQNIAGGSADIGMTMADKSLDEMTQEERRAELLAAEARGEFRM